MALATMFALSSCGNKAVADNVKAEENAEAEKIADDGTTFDGKNFSLVYPKEFAETYSSDDVVNAEDKSGGDCKLDATYNDMGPTLSELKIYAENWTAMKKADDCNVEKPVIDGKVLTIKSVEDDETEIHFVVMKEDRIGIAGSLKFKSEDEAKYEPVVRSIIKSIKFK